jgi:hypothetical protein
MDRELADNNNQEFVLREHQISDQQFQWNRDAPIKEGWAVSVSRGAVGE